MSRTIPHTIEELSGDDSGGSKPEYLLCSGDGTIGEKQCERLICLIQVDRAHDAAIAAWINGQRFPLNLSCERKTICNMLFGNWL